MGKSKSGGLARLPNEQKCEFLIGPDSSWLMPKTTDIWSQPAIHLDHETRNDIKVSPSETSMECDKSHIEDNASLSFFVYGSIGCFCYGEIHHSPNASRVQQGSRNFLDTSNNHEQQRFLGAIVTKLIDIKDDNSRVSCTRFLKQSAHPIVIALTETGSLVIHDCLKSENLIRLKKSEIFTKFLGMNLDELNFNNQQGAKRTKLGITQQINSCAWPNANNIFLGISMIKEKTCFLLRLLLKDQLAARPMGSIIAKDTFVEKSTRVGLELQHYASPICLIESKMLTETICLLAVAMDDGLIMVIAYDLENDITKRRITLARHNDQITSLSFYTTNTSKFPLGLLASVSRDGLVLVWDIENEFYFADYQAVMNDNSNRNSGARIDWFALTFIHLKYSKKVCLAVSNPQSGITMLEVPENTRSKIRLKESKVSGNYSKMAKGVEPPTLKHEKVIFNIEYDSISGTLISSSYDGNHLLWKVQDRQSAANQCPFLELKAQYLIPGLAASSRVHMIRSSPIREDLVSLALGKAGLKFYNMSGNIMNCRFDMSNSCSLIVRRISKAKVSPCSVAWHPNHEYRLAIGTLEGRVFRADITPRKATLIEAEPPRLATNIKKPVDQSNIDADDAFGVEYNPVGHEEVHQNGENRNRIDGVYSLCWGQNPTCPHDVSKFAIYAIGSITHRLFIYVNQEGSDKLTNYLDEFQDTSLPEAQANSSEVAWKPTMDLMALGTLDGKILILTYLEESHEDRSNHKLFKRVAIIEGPFGLSPIQCLAWHPCTDSEDAHYLYLAASSKDSSAFVFNLKESLLIANVRAKLKLDPSVYAPSVDDGELLNQADSMTTTLSAHINKLEAHQKSISDIAWNPHNPDHIATASFDRMCYVWSIDNSFLESKLLSRFAARERLFTMEWSMVEEDLIFTSGHDPTIWAWRPSENVVKTND